MYVCDMILSLVCMVSLIFVWITIRKWKVLLEWNTISMRYFSLQIDLWQDWSMWSPFEKFPKLNPVIKRVFLWISVCRFQDRRWTWRKLAPYYWQFLWFLPQKEVHVLEHLSSTCNGLYTDFTCYFQHSVSNVGIAHQLLRFATILSMKTMWVILIDGGVIPNVHRHLNHMIEEPFAKKSNKSVLSVIPDRINCDNIIKNDFVWSLFLSAVNDMPIVSRSCIWENIYAPKDECMNVNTPSSVKNEFCETCDSDGCNNASQYGPAAMLIIISACFAKILLF